MDVIDILMAKMLSSNADPSAIKDAVEDYLDEHGVTVTETDPNVPAWAKAANPPVASVNGKTGAVELDAEDVGANPEPLEIPISQSDSTYTTTAKAAQIRAAKENSVFVFDGEARTKALLWLPFEEDVDLLIGMQMFNGAITAVAATVTANNVAITVEQIVIPTGTSDLTNDAGYITENDVKTAPIDDTGGYFSNDTVEGALQEIGAELSGLNTLIGSGVIS